MRSRFGLVLEDGSGNSESVPGENLLNVRAIHRFLFMLSERLFATSDTTNEFVTFMSAKIDELHILKPNERSSHIHALIRITQNKLGLNVGDCLSQRELMRFVLREALSRVHHVESRLSFLIDDPDDAEATSHIIDSRFEVLLSNEDLNSRMLIAVSEYLDPVLLFFTPKYPEFCQLMEQICDDSMVLLGDPYHSRILLEQLYEQCKSFEQSPPNIGSHLRVCTLLTLLLTREQPPVRLYLHFRLVHDFFRDDPLLSDLVALFTSLFSIVQNVSADPTKDFVSLLE